MVVSLGEVDQNLAQAKKVKTDFDEVSLGMVFKQSLAGIAGGLRTLGQFRP